MEEELRLNKYLSSLGICSRREADRLIEAGRITVDGRKAVMGMLAGPANTILIDGKRVGSSKPERVVIAYNKPAGIVCTTCNDKNNIVDAIDYPVRIYPVGRLDKESTGLILLTNDGSLVNRILKGSNMHEKEYEVRVDKAFDDEFISRMEKGVPILDTVTRPCRLIRTGSRSFRIILTQGLNRQIRRMCEYFGYRVVKLNRVRIINIELKDLKQGSYRELDEKELGELLQNIGG